MNNRPLLRLHHKQPPLPMGVTPQLHFHRQSKLVGIWCSSSPSHFIDKTLISIKPNTSHLNHDPLVCRFHASQFRGTLFLFLLHFYSPFSVTCSSFRFPVCVSASQFVFPLLLHQILSPILSIAFYCAFFSQYILHSYITVDRVFFFKLFVLHSFCFQGWNPVILWWFDCLYFGDFVQVIEIGWWGLWFWWFCEDALMKYFVMLERLILRKWKMEWKMGLEWKPLFGDFFF